ncbi:MAG: AAA family ATPase [Polyangiales bacterium]
MLELSHPETLGADPDFLVLRAKLGADAKSVLVVRHASAHPSSAAVARLQHSYALREELDPAWACRPITLAPNASGLVLEDPGGVVLASLLGAPMELERCLRIAVGIASSLAHFHARGLIHRDLKPAHTMVDPETGRAWIAGTGLSLRLSRQRQAPEPPTVIAGTLAYMAPEQTGRMNRSTDSRSDLYSLGVALYQMLTGELPFPSSDALELIHCHVARAPTSPALRVPGLPPQLANITLKLLAKNGEDRYQTARGLRADLQRCLTSWLERGTIEPFELASDDISDRLLVPEKLYGREREVSALLDAFDHAVASRSFGLAMVSGYSGIGKSSVANELLKPLVPPRGLFASGKFDQYQRDVPYATVAQAFRSLVRGLLSEDELTRARWREALLHALGDQAQRMVELIPELVQLIGPQPPTPELPPQDSATLFQSAFVAFVRAFAQPSHPLALFLDDLQWLDAATLDLIERLSTDPSIGSLLLVGAYRDNEVGPEHALSLRLASIRKQGVKLTELVLAPLALRDLVSLCADTLHVGPADVEALARVVYAKTGGNPFFAIQFLTTLADEKLLWFDYQLGRFQWDLPAIGGQHAADNVVDLMLTKLRRFPERTRGVLQRLACLGNAASSATLRGLHAPRFPLSDVLEPALRAGLVTRSREGYAFVHDRVREAAYALIPEPERPALHLAIGRAMLANTPATQRAERAFDLTNQLNRSAHTLDDREERRALAELNLIAARRARSATAYSSALNYLASCHALLEPSCWLDNYELVFAAGFHRAECEFLTGDVSAAELHLAELTERARNQTDLARITCLRMSVQTAIDDYPRAIEIGLGYLRTVGIDWSAHPTQEEVGAELTRIHVLRGERSVEALLELPPMTDASWLATCDVLIDMAAPALFTDSNLYALCVGRQVNVALEHGNSEGAPLGYALAGLVFGPQLGDYATAAQLARLAFALLERGYTRYEARVLMVIGHHIGSWTRPLGEARALIQRGLDTALKTGDQVYGCYTISHLITNDCTAGKPLAELVRDCRAGLEFCRKGRFAGMLPAFVSQLSFVRAMGGLPADYDVFGDEASFEAHITSDYRLAVASCGWWTMRQQLRATLLDFAGAVQAELRAKELVWAAMSFFERAEYHFHGALGRAGLCDTLPREEQAPHREALAMHLAQLKLWASTAPTTFVSRAALAEAELLRLDGRELEAQQRYEEAIRSAHEHGFVNNEAVALERASAFYAARGYDLIAVSYLRGARQCYQRWGAHAKVRQLDALYPQLSTEQQRRSLTSTIDAATQQLDLATVLRISAAVSGEIVNEKLMRTLMVTAIENAGAERALLIMVHEGGLRIEAEARTREDGIDVQLARASAVFPALSEAVLEQVVRTRESVLLDDASSARAFPGDAYLERIGGRSVLCLPLVKQSALVGALYLENNLASHVFTAERVAILRLLTSQAASSLDNARLYGELESEYRARTKMQAELAHVTRVATLGELAASIAHEVNQPLAGIVANAGACLRWLNREPSDLDEARAASQRIIRDGKRAAEVVAGLRSLFKKSEAARDPVCLNQVVQDVLSFTRSELNKNELRVRTELLDEAALVLGDRVQLQQVLLNLVLNANDAMRGVLDRERTLLIRSERGVDGLRVSVRDAGSGIAPEMREHLFDAFHTTKTGGLGMGLSISRSIIRDHGGEIDAGAHDGPGTTFVVVLPALTQAALAAS